MQVRVYLHFPFLFYIFYPDSFLITIQMVSEAIVWYGMPRNGKSLLNDTNIFMEMELLPL